MEAKRKEPVTRPQCGSNAGYNLHITNGERSCEPCRVAHNTDSAERRKRLVTGPKRLLVASRTLREVLDQNDLPEGEAAAVEAARNVLRRLAEEAV
jgi:hypothetical protein